jgi:hypothetical protein
MKSLIALSTLLLAGACATQGEQVAYNSADCKVYPITTSSATGVRPPAVDSLEQRHAEMQLATSDYRFRNLRQNAYGMNNVEDALRDCNAR